MPQHCALAEHCALGDGSQECLLVGTEHMKLAAHQDEQVSTKLA